jgi:branched-chain amino acid transport system substrate-binding protein
MATSTCLLVTACGGSGSGESGSASGPIKIGLIAPLTGTYEQLGKGDLQGVTLAVDAVNAAGGIKGRKVQLVTKDDATQPSQAVTSLYGLSSANVVGFIGTLDSSSASSIAPLAQRLKIPMIAPTSNPVVVDPLKHYVFESVPLPKYQALVNMQYLRDTGIKSVAMAYDSASSSMTPMFKAAATYAKQYGIDVAATYDFQSSTTDFSAMLSKLRSVKAQALMVWGSGNAPVILTKQFAAAGLNKKMQLLMPPTEATSSYVQPAGAAAEGVIMDANDAVLGDKLPQSSPFARQVADFAKAYDTKYGGTPPQFATDGYAAAQVLFAAMKSAKSITRDGIADALNNLSVLTVDGKYDFSSTNHGNVTDPNNLAEVQVKNGQFVATPWETKRFGSLPK